MMPLWLAIVLSAAPSGLAGALVALWSRRYTRRAVAALRQDLIDQTNRALRTFTQRQEARFVPLEAHRQSDETREAERQTRAAAVRAKLENMAAHDPRGAVRVFNDG